MRQSAEVENNMTSVERIIYYNDLVSEEDVYGSYNKNKTKQIPSNWPTSGNIEIKNLSVRLNY